MKRLMRKLNLQYTWFLLVMFPGLYIAGHLTGIGGWTYTAFGLGFMFFVWAGTRLSERLDSACDKIVAAVRARRRGSNVLLAL